MAPGAIVARISGPIVFCLTSANIRMTTSPREGVVLRKPEVALSGEVECDEVYVVAGPKGHPEAVARKGDRGDAGG